MSEEAGPWRPVPDGHGILRLPVPPKDFTPNDWRPSSQEFEPTGAEKREEVVRISVWDAELTTAEQARAFRNRACIVLRGAAGAVRIAGFPVVYDPLAGDDARSPGAAGHAAIMNVGRAKDEPKTLWRSRLQGLAEEFELLG